MPPPFAPLPSASWPPCLRWTRIRRRFSPLLQSRNQFHSILYPTANHRVREPVLVEIRVQRTYRSVQIQNPDGIVSLLRQVHDDVGQVRVRSVRPSSLLGDRFDIMSHCSPSLLRCLRQVSSLVLLAGVSKKSLARIRMFRYLGLCHICLLRWKITPLPPRG